MFTIEEEQNRQTKPDTILLRGDRMFNEEEKDMGTAAMKRIDKSKISGTI
jgi:hypothetical protein